MGDLRNAFPVHHNYISRVRTGIDSKKGTELGSVDEILYALFPFTKAILSYEFHVQVKTPPQLVNTQIGMYF